MKKDRNLSLKSEIKEVIIDQKFKAIEKDFQAVHNIQKISYGEFKIVF